MICTNINCDNFALLKLNLNRIMKTNFIRFSAALWAAFTIMTAISCDKITEDPVEEEGPVPVCHLMPCCRVYNRGTKFLINGEWITDHDYTKIEHVRSILTQVQEAGINTVSIDFTNPSQWDDKGQSALHGGDGNELWPESSKQIENIALVTAELGMKFYFFIGNTAYWGLEYWNIIAEYIWNNWADFESYRHYGFGDDRPMLVVFLPGTEFAAQMATATAEQVSYLSKFRIGTCEVNDPITPTETDGWGYRNYSGSSDGKVRFACPNGGVPPTDWKRIKAVEWQARVEWALCAKEYAVLGSYDDTCDAIFWGIADVSKSRTRYHKNDETIDDPYAYYNIVRDALHKE